jgi:two-component system, chemotaxis family, protein-glutamate methylesterase/glutaminase
MTQPSLVLIGASLGGLKAIQSVLSPLAAEFPLAVVIVQHRKSGGDTLTELLQKNCALPVTEAEDKMAIQPGHVYLAPADYHLLAEDGLLALSTDPPVNYARPSIDVLFESAADSYADRAVGILLTGANKDGAAGLAAIRARGGLTVAQDPKTAEAPKMPQAAINADVVDKILPLEEIGPFLARLALPYGKRSDE